MKYAFHPEALIEFSETTRYYAKRSPELGMAFYFEIEKIIQHILENPRLARLIESDVRRALAHRFPYGVFYTLEKDFILIIAIWNFRRNPEQWKARIKKHQAQKQ